jgi:argininosuccinate synthase
MKKVVLAFSGGIGTTACLDLLKRRYQAEVVTLTANLGQRSPADSESLSEHAWEQGVSRTFVEDLRARFISQFVWPSLRAGAIYESGYMLSSALARPLIVSEVVRIAREVGASFIAHGCAAKSNDQIRFENSAAALAPDLQVISPLRDAQLYYGDDIQKYLKERRIPWKESEGCFSITENLWGTTFQWNQVPDTWEPVPESHYRLTVDPMKAPDSPEEVSLIFESGVPVKLDGKVLDPVDILTRLGEQAGRHGVGRMDTFEDRLIGIKTRDVYEQPAATVLHIAKRALESLVLSRDLLSEKAVLSKKYAQLVYDGLWYSELRQAYDAFFNRAVVHVSGEVRVRLFKGQASLVGLRSKNSLYSKRQATTSAEGDDFDHSNVAGLVKTMTRPIKVQSERQHPLWSRELL